MTQPAYPVARTAAARVHSHYVERHRARRVGEPVILELLPDIQTIETMIDVAFWASLRREETYTPLISIAFVGSGHVDLPLVFERPIPFASHPLTRLGPAVERPGIHLCVWHSNDDLMVWGATRNLPPLCFVLEVVAPGELVIKRSRGDNSGKFVNVAVLHGDEIKMIDQPAAAASLSALRSDTESSDTSNVLIQLAVSMRAHGRGGLLLVVPATSLSWRESMLQPISYAVAPPYCALVHLMQESLAERLHRRWYEALRRAVEGVAGLTAVDGATIITDQYELLAFGAKIVRRGGRGQVGAVKVTEPIEGTDPVIAEPGQLGGTRHLSAAQFAHDQRDSIALVASQDGRFTVFGWSPGENMVCANRIETLLL